MSKRRFKSGRGNARMRRAMARADLHNRTLILGDVGDIGDGSTVARDDEFVVVQDEALVAVTIAEAVEDLQDYGLGRWALLATGDYTATPASTSRITMSDTSLMAVGLPVKYVIGGTTYYGLVTVVSTDAYIDVAGAPLSSTITALYVGSAELVIEADFFVADTYGDGVADLLDADEDTAFRWGVAKAYLVAFAVKHKTNDTGANQPKINMKVAGNLVSTEDSNNGPAVSTSWVENSAVAINTSNYNISRDDAVEVSCTSAGSNGDAAHLTVTATFVWA